MMSVRTPAVVDSIPRSEEHTSELQSQSNLVCRLLLEKKKTENTPLTAEAQASPPAHQCRHSHRYPEISEYRRRSLCILVLPSQQRFTSTATCFTCALS